MKIDKISVAIDEYHSYRGKLHALEQARALNIEGAPLAAKVGLKHSLEVDISEIMGEQWVTETLLAAIDKLTLKKAKLKRRLEAASDVIDGKGE